MLIINIYSAIQPRSFECFSYFINSKNSVFIGNIRLMGKDMAYVFQAVFDIMP